MKYLGIVLVRGYQLLVSPLLPGSCKYHPSCSQYALDALRRYGLLKGTVLAAWRLLRCNPWSHGGVDRAEDQKIFQHGETHGSPVGPLLHAYARADSAKAPAGPSPASPTAATRDRAESSRG